MTDLKDIPNSEVFIRVEPEGETIGAFLAIPENPRGVAVFAHGSGSSRHSGRNQYVAGVLNHAGFATLLLDLLTPSEERVDDLTREHRFDIPLLARRVAEGIRWLDGQEGLRDLKVGTFGSSTGAAAAIIAAADLPEQVEAVVSRGGRPDLAGEALERIVAPTLMIVGELDHQVIDLNRGAMERMNAEKVQLDLVPGATHLFSEPGTLEVAAKKARVWFEQHLGVTA